MNDDRLPLPPTDSLSPAQRKAVAAVTSGPRGELIGPFAPLLRAPELMDQLQQVGSHLRYEGALPRDVFELTVLMVARAWDQQFEWGYHHRLAIAAGVMPATAAEIAAGDVPAQLPDGQAAAYDFVTELQRDRQVSDRTWDIAMGRFGDQGVIELITTVGYYTTLAMVMNAAHTPAPNDGSPQLADIGDLTVITDGSAGSGTVVLLHPLGADHRFFDPLLPYLAGRRVLRVDLPGHGATGPLGDYTIAAMATRVARTIRHQGVRSAVVVGTSLGGLIAQQLAVDAPDLVAGLVLADTVVCYPEPLRELWRSRAAELESEATTVSDYLESTIAIWFDEHAPQSALDYVRQVLATTTAAGYAQACHALATADLTGTTGSINVPTALVCGRDDGAAFRAAIDWFAERIPGSTVNWLDHRHATALQDPAPFAATVTAVADAVFPARFPARAEGQHT